MMNQLEQLKQEYAIARDADRAAMRAHIELVDRFYEDRDPGVSQADLEKAAQAAEFTYNERTAAYWRLDACKAQILAEME